MKEFPRLVAPVVGGVPYAWLRVPMGQDWIAEHRLAMQGGRVIVAAIRVYPRTWLDGILNVEKTAVSEERAGLRAEAPLGGLKRRLLKQVKIGAHVDYYGELFRRLPMGQALRSLSTEARRATSVFPRAALAAFLGVPHLAQLAEAPWGARPAARPVGVQRSGRRPLSDEVLVIAAEAYVAHRQRSPRPVPDAAKALKMTEARMRDLVYRARRRGFLTPTDQGRGGGDLTPAARTLLRKIRRRTSPRRRKP